MKNKNVNFIKGKEEKTMKKEVYAPYNLKYLKESTIGKVCLKEGRVGWNPQQYVVGYEIVPSTLEEFIKDGNYADFNIKGHNMQQVLDTLTEYYSSGDSKKIEQAKGMYVRVCDAIRAYNEEYTHTLGQDMDFRLHRDAYKSYWADRFNKDNLDYKKLMLCWELPTNGQRAKIEESLKDLAPNKRAAWMLKADEHGFTFHHQVSNLLSNASEDVREMRDTWNADFGLTVPTTTLRRCDVFTMRLAPIAHEADSIHPWNIYHKADANDPIVTFVGKTTQEVTLDADKDNTTLAAKWYEQFGDEFMEKCRPFYDIAYAYDYTVTEDLYEDDDCTIYTETVTRWVTETEVLFTGTQEECYARLDAYREDYPTAVVLPSDKEITVREARLRGIGEYASYGEDGKCFIRDFQYDGGDIDE